MRKLKALFRMALLTAVLTSAAQAAAVKTADEPVNYDDPNLARADEFAGDELDSKLTAPDIQKVVKVLESSSRSSDKSRTTSR